MLIRAILKNDPTGYLPKGLAMEVESSAIVAISRNSDGAVTLLTTGGAVFQTQLNLQRVKDVIQEARGS